MTDRLDISDAEFWRRPLAARMADFAEIREEGPFHKSTILDLLSDHMEDYYAVTRYDELVEISKRPKDF
jgi:hypothetical protein